MTDKEIDWESFLKEKNQQMKMIHFITQITRFKILSLLVAQQPSMPLYVKEIAKKINCSERIVSHQIPLMQYWGWVDTQVDISNKGKLIKLVNINSRNRTRIIRFYEVIEEIIAPKVMLEGNLT